MKRTNRYDRAAVVALFAVALFLTALFAVVAFQSANTRQIDLPQFYAAAKLASSGQIARLYDRSAYRKLLPDGITLENDYSIYFNRPAFLALALLPAGHVSYQTFYWASLVFNLLLLAVLSWRLPRWFPAHPITHILLFGFQPFLLSATLGQDTLGVTLAVAYGIVLCCRGRELSGGALMAIAVAKPHLVWAIPIALASQRKWKALAGFMGVATALMALSLALVGPIGIGQWIALLAAPTTDAKPELMANVRSVSLLYGMPAGISLAAAVGVCFVICLWKKQPAIALGAALYAGPILNYHSYVQDYSLGAVAGLICPNPFVRYFILAPLPLLHAYSGLSGTAFILIGLAYLAWGAFSRRSSEGLGMTGFKSQRAEETTAVSRQP